MSSSSSATNKFLSSIHVNPTTDRFIHIRETNLADANFVLTYILKEIVSDDRNALIFINLHNTIGHYQNIGRRLNFNLLEKIERKEAVCLNAIQDARKLISGETNPETYLQALKEEINAKICNFLTRNAGEVFIVIDDFSHFLDLSIPYAVVMRFVNFCIHLLDNERVRVVIGNHHSEIPGEDDTMLSNLLSYASDVIVTVSALKTGACPGVSGVLTVQKNNSEETFHYKTGEKDVQVFNPGTALEALRI